MSQAFKVILCYRLRLKPACRIHKTKIQKSNKTEDFNFSFEIFIYLFIWVRWGVWGGGGLLGGGGGGGHPPGTWGGGDRGEKNYKREIKIKNIFSKKS